MSAASEERKGKRDADMERVLAYLAQGTTITEAMRRVGRARVTYFSWKKAVPSFGQRAESIIARRTQSAVEVVTEEGTIDLTTLSGFRKHYFGYDTFAHQQLMIDAIEDAPGGAATMILMPPEWMKTTTVEDYICKKIADNPNIRICVISEAVGHAEKILGRVKRRMTDRAMAQSYMDDFGPFKAPERAMQKVWNNHQITVLRSTHDERDYTLECRGAGAKIYGSRYDIIILDDIQSRTSSGVKQTEKLLDLYRQDWKTRPGKTGKMIVLGTRVAKVDIYSKLLESELIHKLVRIPARDKDGNSNFPPVLDAAGNRQVSGSGDPLGWSDDELKKREIDMGPEIWDRVYMQRSRSVAGGSFTSDSIERAFDNDRPCGGKERGHKGLGRISGLDPALGGFAAFVSCSFDANTLYIEGIRNVPGLNRNEEIFDILEQETIEHLPECWVIERNNMQHGLARDDRLMMLRDKYGFYVQEHYTDQTKLDEKIGIPSMAGAFRRGEIRLPGTPEARIAMQPLTEELIDWRIDIPAKELTQDLVMALWFVYLKWMTLKASLVQDLVSFDRTASPGMTAYKTTIGTWR